MNQNWTRTSSARAPNLASFISHFNRVSTHVATSILSHIDLKLRARVLGRWVEVAGHLADLQNFDGVMQVSCAVRAHTQRRLADSPLP